MEAVNQVSLTKPCRQEAARLRDGMAEVIRLAYAFVAQRATIRTEELYAAFVRAMGATADHFHAVGQCLLLQGDTPGISYERRLGYFGVAAVELEEFIARESRDDVSYFSQGAMIVVLIPLKDHQRTRVGTVVLLCRESERSLVSRRIQQFATRTWTQPILNYVHSQTRARHELHSPISSLGVLATMRFLEQLFLVIRDALEANFDAHFEVLLWAMDHQQREVGLLATTGHDAEYGESSSLAGDACYHGSYILGNEVGCNPTDRRQFGRSDKARATGLYKILTSAVASPIEERSAAAVSIYCMEKASLKPGSQAAFGVIQEIASYIGQFVTKLLLDLRRSTHRRLVLDDLRGLAERSGVRLHDLIDSLAEVTDSRGVVVVVSKGQTELRRIRCGNLEKNTPRWREGVMRAVADSANAGERSPTSTYVSSTVYSCNSQNTEGCRVLSSSHRDPWTAEVTTVCLCRSACQPVFTDIETSIILDSIPLIVALSQISTSREWEEARGKQSIGFIRAEPDPIHRDCEGHVSDV